MRIAIIGGGFAGLSLAPLLAKEGNQVEVFEKNDRPGGRAMIWRKNGFRFDMGPSWYLMPEVFEHYFSHFNKKPQDFYKLVRLNPNYKVFFENYKPITISKDLKKNMTIFSELESQGDVKLRRYLDQAKYQYKVAMNEFIYKNYDNWSDFFTFKMLKESRKLKLFTSLDKKVSGIFSSPEAQKILLYATVFLGADPRSLPGFYSLMSHVDFNLGVWYPIGGMSSVVDTLYKLGKEYKVKYHFNSPVNKIHANKNTVWGVEVQGNNLTFDKVVSTADYAHTELELLSKNQRSYTAKYWRKKQIAPSAILMYLGFSKKLPRLAHHNLYFTGDWNLHFDAIYKNPTWPHNFSFYLSAPSKTDSSVSPKNNENIFVLIPLSSGLKDTKKIKEEYFNKIIEWLEKETKVKNLRNKLVVKRIFAQSDFVSNFNAYEGTALGLAHTLFQTAVFRPSMKSKSMENLYYCGQYTHPGIGVPMVMIASEILNHELKAKHDTP